MAEDASTIIIRSMIAMGTHTGKRTASARLLEGCMEASNDAAMHARFFPAAIIGRFSKAGCSRVGKRLDKARCSPTGYDQRPMEPNKA
jgi:hypothetical protein